MTDYNTLLSLIPYIGYRSCGSVAAHGIAHPFVLYAFSVAFSPWFGTALAPKTKTKTTSALRRALHPCHLAWTGRSLLWMFLVRSMVATRSRLALSCFAASVMRPLRRKLPRLLLLSLLLLLLLHWLLLLLLLLLRFLFKPGRPRQALMLIPRLVSESDADDDELTSPTRQALVTQLKQSRGTMALARKATEEAGVTTAAAKASMAILQAEVATVTADNLAMREAIDALVRSPSAPACLSPVRLRDSISAKDVLSSIDTFTGHKDKSSDSVHVEEFVRFHEWFVAASWKLSTASIPLDSQAPLLCTKLQSA